MTIQDDRTPDQKATHHVLVLGTDSFLSGWGGARGGASYAAWACTPQDADRVYAWVSGRSDMKRVRVVGNGYRPGRHCAHLHIYVVDDGHRALEA